MKIAEVKEKYKEEWVLLEVLKADRLGKVLEGKIIAHSKNRDDTYEAMGKIKVNHVAHFWNGEFPDDYSAAFPQVS